MGTRFRLDTSGLARFGPTGSGPTRICQIRPGLIGTGPIRSGKTVRLIRTGLIWAGPNEDWPKKVTAADLHQHAKSGHRRWRARRHDLDVGTEDQGITNEYAKGNHASDTLDVHASG